MSDFSKTEPVVLQFSETKRIATINGCGGDIRVADITVFFAMIDALPATFQPVVHELVIMPSVPQDIVEVTLVMAAERSIPVVMLGNTVNHSNFMADAA